jgi:hypothetical protein
LILIEGFMAATVREIDHVLPTRPPLAAARSDEPISVGLSAAIVSVVGDEPVVAVVPNRGAHAPDAALPCGRFSPRQHKTLETGLRFWVRQQTGIELGVARQICTLGDCEGAQAELAVPDPAVVSVCYLAPVRPQQCSEAGDATWQSWYAYFPWEDWRRGKPRCLTEMIEPRLEAWAAVLLDGGEGKGDGDGSSRSRRLRMAFGRGSAAWDEEKVLERYELLCEAGVAGDGAEAAQGTWSAGPLAPRLAHPLLGDHARVLASAIGELRRCLKCEPIIFELMPDVFTLFELQKTVEAILGPHLHKQNFRRLVESGGLVEPTGEHRLRTGGRPARLYRFRSDVLLERLAPGVRVKAGRG